MRDVHNAMNRLIRKARCWAAKTLWTDRPFWWLCVSDCVKLRENRRHLFNQIKNTSTHTHIAQHTQNTRHINNRARIERLCAFHNTVVVCGKECFCVCVCWWFPRLRPEFMHVNPFDSRKCSAYLCFFSSTMLKSESGNHRSWVQNVRVWISLIYFFSLWEALFPWRNWHRIPSVG